MDLNGLKEMILFFYANKHLYERMAGIRTAEEIYGTTERILSNENSNGI